MKDTEVNPRPNHRLSRCCGNCRFFLSPTSNAKKGVCVLPMGPLLTNNINVDLQNRQDEFDPTHIHCECDNHQWKPTAWLKDSIRYSGVDPV